jgi:hypothetical protein
MADRRPTLLSLALNSLVQIGIDASGQGSRTSVSDVGNLHGHHHDDTADEHCNAPVACMGFREARREKDGLGSDHQTGVRPGYGGRTPGSKHSFDRARTLALALKPIGRGCAGDQAEGDRRVPYASQRAPDGE